MVTGMGNSADRKREGSGQEPPSVPKSQVYENDSCSAESDVPETTYVLPQEGLALNLGQDLVVTYRGLQGRQVHSTGKGEAEVNGGRWMSQPMLQLYNVAKKRCRRGYPITLQVHLFPVKALPVLEIS